MIRWEIQKDILCIVQLQMIRRRIYDYKKHSCYFSKIGFIIYFPHEQGGFLSHHFHR